MHLDGVALLLSENARARAYVSQLLSASLRPAAAVVVESPEMVHAPTQRRETPLFNNTTSVKQQLVEAGIEMHVVQAEIFNDVLVTQAVSSLKQAIVIFAASAGSLLRQPFFRLGKTYLHVHPGRLPDYRGSTPMYYSLLREGNLTMTAFIMAEELDAGAVLMERCFPAPQPRTDIDLFFDPYLRACVLVELMQFYAEHRCLPETREMTAVGEIYYVIHPVLKHIALLADL